MLPGDELLPRPSFQATNAINVDAPPEAVWPWIAQMGRERTGYYALDLLTNQGVPSVTFLRKDIPAPQVNMVMDDGARIANLRDNRELLLSGSSLKHPVGFQYDMTALYLLERRRDGSTRLLIRRRMLAHGFWEKVFVAVYEPTYFVFVMQQLNKIRHYAEAMGNRNLLFHSTDYAKGTIWGGIIAPPTFTDCIAPSWGTVGPRGTKRSELKFRIGGEPAGPKRQWFQVIRPGDRFRVIDRYIGLVERKSRQPRPYRLLIDTWLRTLMNQRDETVATVEEAKKHLTQDQRRALFGEVGESGRAGQIQSNGTKSIVKKIKEKIRGK